MDIFDRIHNTDPITLPIYITEGERGKLSLVYSTNWVEFSSSHSSLAAPPALLQFLKPCHSYKSIVPRPIHCAPLRWLPFTLVYTLVG